MVFSSSGPRRASDPHANATAGHLTHPSARKGQPGLPDNYLFHAEEPFKLGCGQEEMRGNGSENFPTQTLWTQTTKATR